MGDPQYYNIFKRLAETHSSFKCNPGRDVLEEAVVAAAETAYGSEHFFFGEDSSDLLESDHLIKAMHKTYGFPKIYLADGSMVDSKLIQNVEAEIFVPSENREFGDSFPFLYVGMRPFWFGERPEVYIYRLKDQHLKASFKDPKLSRDLFDAFFQKAMPPVFSPVAA